MPAIGSVFFEINPWSGAFTIGLLHLHAIKAVLDGFQLATFRMHVTNRCRLISLRLLLVLSSWLSIAPNSLMLNSGRSVVVLMLSWVCELLRLVTPTFIHWHLHMPANAGCMSCVFSYYIHEHFHSPILERTWHAMERLRCFIHGPRHCSVAYARLQEAVQQLCPLPYWTWTHCRLTPALFFYVIHIHSLCSSLVCVVSGVRSKVATGSPCLTPHAVTPTVSVWLRTTKIASDLSINTQSLLITTSVVHVIEPYAG